MPVLRDFLNQDMRVFFNADEFSSSHKINGHDVIITVDHDLLKERQSKCAEGTYIGDLLFHIKKEDFGEAPAISQTIRFDDDIMRVTDFQEDMGIYIITLGANMS